VKQKPNVVEPVVSRAWQQTKYGTSWAIKTCHFVFDYDSAILKLFLLFFVPVETDMNILQYANLVAW